MLRSTINGKCDKEAVSKGQKVLVAATVCLRLVEFLLSPESFFNFHTPLNGKGVT